MDKHYASESQSDPDSADEPSGKVQDSIDGSDSDTTSVEYPALNIITNVNASTMSKVSKWDKRHFCKFCDEPVLKLHRHMSRKHKTEIEVAQIMSMPVRSKERRIAWGNILKEGDYKHNFDVMKEKTGTIVPKYRTKNSSTANLIPCVNCKGMYSRKYLYQHYRRCMKLKSTVKVRGVAKKGFQL